MQKGFGYYYLRSMRLYYSFVTGTTTLGGVVWAHRIHGYVWGWRDIVVLTVGYLAWGVNQIFSDWQDRHEDKINAPYRPMVSGKLSSRAAMTLSALLMGLFAAGSFLLSPLSLLFLVLGGGLNIGYSLLKKIPVLNCLIYSLAISCCAFYGYSGVCGVLPAWDLQNFIPFVFLIPAHFLMCSFSYYKDKDGDRQCGIYTLQNLFSDKITLPFHWIAGALYTCLLCGYAGRVTPEYKNAAIFFALANVLILCILYFLLEKCKYHLATCWNCILCVSWLSACLLPFFGEIMLFSPFFMIAIWLLYRWSPDEKK